MYAMVFQEDNFMKCFFDSFRRLLLLHKRNTTQQTQNISITFVQRRPNVFDAGPTLYKCYTNVLCLLGISQCCFDRLRIENYHENNLSSIDLKNWNNYADYSKGGGGVLMTAETVINIEQARLLWKFQLKNYTRSILVLCINFLQCVWPSTQAFL